jgi:hypothetical protein
VAGVDWGYEAIGRAMAANSKAVRTRRMVIEDLLR